MKQRKRGLWRIALCGALCTGVLAASAGAASAQATVTGNVKLPDPSVRGEPPERNSGFLPRMRNPIIPPVPHDPTPWMVIVLQPKGTLADADKQPPKIPPRYELREESFAAPILPMTAGGQLEVHNVGRNAHRLESPGRPELIDPAPINPNGKRTAKLSEPYRTVPLEDADSTHLRAYVVAFPHPYFSRIAPNGDFTIENVPTGRWTVRVWYRDGWLKMKQPEIDVDGRRAESPRITLPPSLVIEPPESGE